ncbi:hypothetical protein WA1_23285 [Scytonema hofmannii PCC 7110]|uniref:Uncharacterized protein n=1 Tax=Scytonema hofmannii PCC 7110 TaxID=128403 RepID=A0A139X8L5_9CYAN|nr:hypothetical protein WA1_23285 [Scytonema hofmannii PCC 7110]
MRCAYPGVKDDKQCKSLLKIAVSENLSLSQIKEKIANLKTETKEEKKGADRAVAYSQRLKNIYTKAKKIKSLD